MSQLRIYTVFIISALIINWSSRAQEPNRISGAPIQQLFGKWVGSCSRNGKTDAWTVGFVGLIKPTTQINGTSAHWEYDDNTGKHIVFDGRFTNDFKTISGQLKYRSQAADCRADITPNTDMLCIVNPSTSPEVIALRPDVGGRGKFTLEGGKQEIRPGDVTGALMWSHQDFDINNPPNTISPATRYLCQ